MDEFSGKNMMIGIALNLATLIGVIIGFVGGFLSYYFVWGFVVWCIGVAIIIGTLVVNIKNLKRSKFNIPVIVMKAIFLLLLIIMIIGAISNFS